MYRVGYIVHCTARIQGYRVGYIVNCTARLHVQGRIHCSLYSYDSRVQGRIHCTLYSYDSRVQSTGQSTILIDERRTVAVEIATQWSKGCKHSRKLIQRLQALTQTDPKVASSHAKMKKKFSKYFPKTQVQN